MVYRAYRYPYNYVPQLERPIETPIAPIDVTRFHVPGAAPHTPKNVSEFKSGENFDLEAQLCIIADADMKKNKS